MKYILAILLICALTCGVEAKCPYADAMAKKKGFAEVVSLYESCAMHMNDDDSQILLAEAYSKGLNGVTPRPQRALLFYHLSAENGNAVAQAELSRLLTSLDENEEGRALLKQYLSKLSKPVNSKRNKSTFSGTILHPYTLLLLSTERAENKWFYTSKQLTAPAGTQARLNSFVIEDDKKQAAMSDASKWKQVKLLQVAEEILDRNQYRDFYYTLFPATGMVDEFARAQAVEDLRKRTKEYRLARG